MDETFARFLQESPIARTVALQGRVVVHSMSLTLKELSTFLSQKVSSIGGRRGLYDLEVGGQMIARGRIVKKRDGYYFKVTKTLQGGKNDNA